MTAIELLESKRPQIDELCRRNGVLRLRVFGSAVRDDWDASTSDFDFVAEFGAPPRGINLLASTRSTGRPSRRSRSTGRSTGW